MQHDRPTVVIVQSSYYTDVTNMLRTSVVTELENAGYDHEIIDVPGVFEVPTAIKLAMDRKKPAYEGAIALGCVIRGETDHYDHICRESSRALMELAMSGVALGFGILTCENYEQAIVRADINGKNKGKEIATACLRIIALKLQMH